ncbi:MAG: insulinase family protein [Coprothermobacterota bacterium]|nr:insulinase family protein [Coprothermobacterota bacterium]
MKNWTKVLIVVATLLSFLFSGCTTSRTSSLDLGKLVTLPNGFKIIHRQYPYEKKVLIGLVVQAGEAYAPKKLPGISHLLEHVVARGIIEEGQKELKDFQPYSDCNAQTGIIGVTYYLRCYPEEYEKALGILEKNLTSPDYGLLQEEKTRWIQEVRNVNLNPPGAIVHEIDRLLYQDHPFGNRGKGMDSGLAPLTEASSTPSVLEEFRSAYYTPERMTLVVLGPMKEVKVKAFSRLPEGKKENPLPSLLKGNKREITKSVVSSWSLTYSIPNPQGTGTSGPYAEMQVVPSYLALGWAGFPPEKREVFDLLGTILSSRLQSKMAEAGLLGGSSMAGIQLPFSFGIAFVDVNAFQLLLTTETKDLSKIREVVFQTIREAGENLSEEELAAAKLRQRANIATLLADPVSYLNLLAQYLPILGFSYLQELPAKYENATLEDLKEAVSFLDENYALVFYQGSSLK